ncbi:MAG: DUF5666 domain-containing protein, partial [bacterium]|nr:DUF5666 domain-containing protein [bacterium]
PPAEILASDQYNIYPMMGASESAASGVAAQTAPQATAPSSVTCISFASRDSASGNTVACPKPAAVVPSSAPSAEVKSENSADIMLYPSIMPIRYQPYRIKIDASTRLYLRDRRAATLGDFTSGDKINVFGYYNADGSIQAYLVRDLSKPVISEFIQLNNVTLVSISATSRPATLVVAQSQWYPCYGFGVDGGARQSMPCPMGVMSPAGNAAMKDLASPQMIVPEWAMMRKYVVRIDAGTVILDSNRTQLQLSDLRVGDELNVYGETLDNGQTISADIVRDLSVPATPKTLNGTVSQVNADGSFVIKTDDGQVITVSNSIKVGVRVEVTGLLNRLKNILSEVSSIIIGSGRGYPVPMPATMIRAQ